jgi:hypothetical protein
MPYQNDMNSLADLIGGAGAAGQAMEQNDIENQKTRMENQVYQQKMPALGEEQSLKNLFTKAQTSTQEGIAQQQQAAGQQAQALLPSGIKAGQAENETKYSTQKLKQLGQVGQIAGQIAGMMDNIPEAARPAAMQGLAQKYGIDPQALGPMANGDPDMLRKFSTSIATSSQNYIQKIGELQQQGSNAENVANIGANARTAAAEASANARVQAANITAQMRHNQQTFEQRANELAKTDPEAAQRYAQMALQLKQAQAGITSQLVTGQGLQVPDLSTGGGQQTASPTQQGAPDMAGAMAEARKRGLIK